MGEWRRCPGCGFTRCGVCPFCYPDGAQQERAAERAEFERELQQAERRAAGMIHCGEHGEYDGCWSVVRWPEARSSPESEPERPVHWTEAMARLRRKYRADY